MKIPKIIHQIWLDKPSMTQFFIKLTDTWKTKNPEYKHILWDKDNAQSFLEENFSNWLPFYEQLTYNVQRFDLLRYLILIKYGGIYVDADYECLHKIDSILENQEIAFGLEPEKYAKFHQSSYFLGNCFMASIPEHPFLIEFTELIKVNIPLIDIDKDDKYRYVMSTTGPIALNQFYHEYQNKNSISLIESEIVCPLDSKEAKDYYLGGSNVIYSEKLKNAKAIHLFAGTWL
ncbi:glycosyl transferase-like sugar-binding protein [Arcicella aurantiaca]|uniref:Glycosyl transferase-like sugar-binding protein n=1 Tax=Arcicella aurantiaca TaxID=591202 RepID=A0A316DFH9_9BACT|nr:glycosyltransferase [Arcicella aurantiaca]PWK16675.1 glycosyl transferase-like sugar-binding protein [Arcicella aurantiaca]